MKFLCLPGAFSSAENYKVQLAPFVSEMCSDDSATFVFTQGEVNCTPPKGFENYFGPAPHYRFVSYDGLEEGQDALERIRDFPEGASPEDVMREIFPEGSADVSDSIQRALDGVYKTIEREGPFDGIIGYSEGATVACTLILDEKRREELEGRERTIKCGIFFAGWPPAMPGEGNVALAEDDSDVLIDIPTCHVVGAGDPYLHGSMALYNLCDEDSSSFFDHGKGHTLPRDPRTIKELGEVVRDMIDRVSGSGMSSPASHDY